MPKQRRSPRATLYSPPPSQALELRARCGCGPRRDRAAASLRPATECRTGSPWRRARSTQPLSFLLKDPDFQRRLCRESAVIATASSARDLSRGEIAASAGGRRRGARREVARTAAVRPVPADRPSARLPRLRGTPHRGSADQHLLGAPFPVARRDRFGGCVAEGRGLSASDGEDHIGDRGHRVDRRTHDAARRPVVGPFVRRENDARLRPRAPDTAPSAAGRAPAGSRIAKAAPDHIDHVSAVERGAQHSGSSAIEPRSGLAAPIGNDGAVLGGRIHEAPARQCVPRL